MIVAEVLLNFRKEFPLLHRGVDHLGLVGRMHPFAPKRREFFSAAVLPLTVTRHVGLLTLYAIAHRRAMERLRRVANVVGENAGRRDELGRLAGRVFFHPLEELPHTKWQDAAME